MPSTAIVPRDSPITLINVFSVDSGRQDQLIQLLYEATEKDQPGFVSANIHKSLDGTRVVN